jgi:hypothetical protein
MDDEIGIAADRRCEMRIAAQVQAEVPVVVGGVLGLRLRAQHHIVDDLLVLGAAHLGEDAVELPGRDDLALGELDADRRQELAERMQLLD